MSNEAVALIGFVSLFVLMLLRVPVGMAMGLVGITGFGYLTGFAPALKLIGQTTMRTVTDYSFGVIPMFLLMGAFVSVSGISRELFRAANTFVGHWKGGLGIATIAACGGFAAISGSSVATAATFCGGLSRNAPLRLSAILCHRRDRGRRHAWRDAAAVDGAGCVRHHHPAGYRQAVHRRHRAGTAGNRDAHDHHRHHRCGAARLSSRRPAGFVA
jgi:hypothetical protein